MSYRNEKHEKYFQFQDLVTGKKRTVAEDFNTLLKLMNEMIIEGPEKSAGVRKLLEAQDCFIRSCEED